MDSVWCVLVCVCVYVYVYVYVCVCVCVCVCVSERERGSELERERERERERGREKERESQRERERERKRKKERENVCESVTWIYSQTVRWQNVSLSLFVLLVSQDLLAPHNHYNHQAKDEPLKGNRRALWCTGSRHF